MTYTELVPPASRAAAGTIPLPAWFGLLFAADGEKVEPGLRANLIVEAYPEASAKTGGARTPLGTLPAIPFEVLKIGQ